MTTTSDYFGEAAEALKIQQATYNRAVRLGDATLDDVSELAANAIALAHVAELRTDRTNRPAPDGEMTELVNDGPQDANGAPERKGSDGRLFTGRDILAVPMVQNSAGARTVGHYLVALLSRTWSLGEEFSGKRPFGNSDWTAEVWRALVLACVLDGSVDEDGIIEDIDAEQADDMVQLAIGALREFVVSVAGASS